MTSALMSASFQKEKATMVKTVVRTVRHAMFLAVLLFLAWFGGAKAQSIVYTDTEPIVFANTPYTLTFNQFNPALGV